MAKIPNEHLLTEEQLAVLIGPRTREVMDAFLHHGVLSASDLQNLLSFESKAVYYQIKKLVAAGLVTPSPRRKGPAAYQPVARVLRMPNGFQTLELLAAKAVEARLKQAARHFRAAAEATERDNQAAQFLFSNGRHLKLAPSQLQALLGDMRDLIMRYQSIEPTEGAKSVRVQIITYPEIQS